MRKPVYLLWLLCFYLFSNAQLPVYNILRTPVNDRLSNQNITAFARDSAGFLWMGTNRGLNRYNGSTFVHFLQNDSASIINDNIHALLVDGDNNLWIGTDGGPDLYSISEDQFTHLSNGYYNPVYSLSELDRGHIVFSDLSGISVLDKETLSVVNSFRSKELGLSGNLLVTADGNIWVASSISSLIYVFTPELRLIEKITLPGTERVIDLNQSVDDNVWVATDNNIYCFDPVSRTFKHVPEKLQSLIQHKKILFMCYSKGEAQFTIGIKNSGLYSFNPHTSDINQVIPQKRFGSVDECHCFIDSDNTIWLAPSNKGFRVFPKVSIFESHYVHDTFKDAPIRQMGLFSENQLWFSSEKDIVLFNTSRKESLLITPSDLPSDTPIQQCLIENARTMALVTGNTLRFYTFDRQRSQFNKKYAFDENIHLVWKDTQDNYWLQLETHLGMISKDGDAIVHRPGNENYIFRNSTVIMPEGNTYLFSFNKGLITYDKQMQFVRFAPEISNPSSIFKDSEGNLWIGSFNNGLYRYTASGQAIDHYTTENGLPDNSIMSVLEDDNRNLWICSRNGISRFSADQQHFTDFTNDNFIRDAQFEIGCVVKTADGTLYFGNNNGVSIIHPHQPVKSEKHIPLQIDGILVNRQPVVYEQDRGVRLEHDENFLSIYYSGLDLTTGHLLHYAYKLEGYDKDWTHAGQNYRARYANLPHGSYTFRLKVQDSNGFWGKDELALGITIKPAWWYSLPALILYLCIAILFVYILLALYIRWKVNRKQLELVEREKVLNEELNQAKIDFFTNISHEFRTPLSLIYAPVKELSAKAQLNKHESKLLDLVKTNSERLLKLSDQLLRFEKLENTQEKLAVAETELVSFLVSLTENFQFLASEKEIDFSTRFPEQLTGYFDTEKIEKILFNLLTNAVKYSNPGDSVAISVAESQDGTAVITVADTGIGIPKEEKEKIFKRFERLESVNQHTDADGFGIGLHYALHLAKLHKGTIRLEENTPKGCRFSLILLYKKEAYSTDEFITDTTLLSTNSLPVKDQSTAPENNETKEHTILLVEDNKEVRLYLKDLFSAHYNVITAQDGEEAIELLKINLPDIIISDVVMPRKNGFALCEEIKNNPEYSHLPVILLTAKTDIRHQIKGLNTGADAYVGKPFDPVYLETVVENMLANRKRLQRIVEGLTLDTLEELNEDETMLSPQEQQFLEKVYLLLDQHLSDEEYNVLSLTKELGLSRSSLYSKIKSLTGKSPQNFLITYRMNKAMAMLKTGEYLVSEVCYKVGFSSLAGFSRSFKRQFGFPPSTVVTEGRSKE